MSYNKVCARFEAVNQSSKCEEGFKPGFCATCTKDDNRVKPFGPFNQVRKL